MKGDGLKASEGEKPIGTRKELFDFLEKQMQRSYRELLGSQRLEYEETMVKSYLLEVDVPEGMDETAWLEFLRELFSVPDRNISAEVLPKEEEGFYEVQAVDKFGKMRLFLDTATDRRFWFAFSMSRATRLDRWMRLLSNYKSAFDRVWLWVSFLEDIQDQGEPKGFGLDYDFRKFRPDGETISYLKMQIWGDEKTKDLYNMLKNWRSAEVVLSKVRMKKWASPQEQSDGFALEDIKYDGKWTVRGTDIHVHLGTLSETRRRYREVIKRIEEKYALSWDKASEGGLELRGAAIHFSPEFGNIPLEPKAFAKEVFKGTEPFRLMGFVDRQGKDYIAAELVDLHSGGTLSVEVYPEAISLYVPRGTCGNTVARFYTNLQHYIGARFKVEADDGEPVF